MCQIYRDLSKTVIWAVLHPAVGFLMDTLLIYMIVLLYICNRINHLSWIFFLVPAKKVIPYIEWGLCVPATCSAEDVGFGLLDILEIACKFLGSTDLKYWWSFGQGPICWNLLSIDSYKLLFMINISCFFNINYC